VLELSPVFWERTRARLEPNQLTAEFGSSGMSMCPPIRSRRPRRFDNNRSERELRRQAVGRKNWLFVWQRRRRQMER
jgi:hypothetical protein